MSLDIGFDTQAPSLPKGGGSVGGLGETFTPDLSMGTGTFVVRLDLPNGPNDIGPRLVLRYDTSSGNGPFGMGFSIPLPRVLRSTAKGYPRFDDADALVLEGAGELVPLGGGAYRPQVDGGMWSIEGHGDGFRATDREGIWYYLGTSPDSQLAAGSRVYAWHLERVEDALGNHADFTWMRDGNQLYLSSIRYGIYEVRFVYQPRPDPLRRGRAGFPITTELRCDRIELRIPDQAQPLVRSWRLEYVPHSVNGSSLVERITLSGIDAAGVRIDAPPLTLSYSGVKAGTLKRYRSADEGAEPGPLQRTGRHIELVDWDGNGLPDLLEIGGNGEARLWPNIGDCTWGRPRFLGAMPLFSPPTASVGLIDMNGDGIADLVRLDRPLNGYIPRDADGGFAHPVSLDSAPSPLPVDPSTRLVDLDGDGVVDLLASSDAGLTLHYRRDDRGWASPPQVVSHGIAPDVRLSDAHVFLADMVGDGMRDLVRVDGGGVTYWPYLGLGRWDAPVTMANPPDLPYDFDPAKLIVSDIDGDGCADVIYADRGRILYWINQCGSGFSAPRVIEYVPHVEGDNVRLADMGGSGISGMLWARNGPFGRGTVYYYLDLSGDSKPYLMNRIDNGVGQVTEIEYSTSAHQAAADMRTGRPWRTSLPVAIPVVSAFTVHDVASGVACRTEFHYHDGRLDGVLREFAGFGCVDQDQIGDASIPTLRTTTWFHNGVDPEQPSDVQSTEDRRRRRAVRGRIYRQERFGIDDSPLAGLPYDRLTQVWTVTTQTTAGGSVYVPRLAQSVRSGFERAASPSVIMTTTNNSWDASGTVIDSTQICEVPGDPSQRRTLRTQTYVAADPSGRFVSRIWRVRQSDENGEIVSDVITEYDNLPEGAVGAQGLMTRRSALVVSDAQAADVYGDEMPDFAGLGYFRRLGETGWWVEQARYHRVVDAAGLHGEVTGPAGAPTTFEYDANQIYPVRVTDPRGNTLLADHDYRVCRVSCLTDVSGQSYTATYDALARATSVVEPGDSSLLPTTTYDYRTTTIPAEILIKRRSVSGDTTTIDSREIVDGAGRVLERRERDGEGEIAVLRQQYNVRGLPAATFAPRRPSSVAFEPTDDSWVHVTFLYDAMGRLIGQANPDGSTRRTVYSPLLVEEFDEEDLRVGGPHAGTSLRRHYDGTGRVSAVEENLGGRLLRSTYRYDLKGNLIEHADALGNTVTMWYDFLGRPLRIDRPEHGTVSVFDAAGNAVEARTRNGTHVYRDFDECNRPVTVRLNAAGATPAITFLYHDAGMPAPAEAGVHTIGGRIARIDDEGGASEYDYDERGRLTTRRYTPSGSTKNYRIDYHYRADGQVDRIQYPDGGGGRKAVTYEYDPWGRLLRIPSLLDSIEYDISGRRSRIRYANGTEQHNDFDPFKGTLSAQRLTNAAGLLRETRFTLDTRGNPVRIDSPDPRLAARFTYDDLYRLVEARTDSGDSWIYRYDDAGNITHKSDVGDYRYGELGAPATCLTSAGAQTFTYSPLGEMVDTPWGQQTFDAMGRLRQITGPGGDGEVTFRYDYSGVRVAVTSGNGSPVIDILTPDPLFSVDNGVLVLNYYDGQVMAGREPEGGAMTFQHYDHQGSRVLATDSAGHVVESIRYDPYGKVLEHTGTTSSPAGYTGGVPDTWSGLLYLNARYYHPSLGRFVSPDVVVQNVLSPISWNSYQYCGDNPVTFVDPSGRGFWGIFLAALAIIALIVVVAICVVADVFTFGALTPAVAALVGVGIVVVGAVVGGVIGGLSAAAKGGNAEDILTGVLVGVAVGGWAAFASCFAGTAFTSAVGIQGFGGAVVGGAINGAVSGTAMGFAAGYAGGKGSLDDIWSKVWQGFVVGAVAGAIMGGISYAISPPSTSLQGAMKDAFTPQAPSGAPAGSVPADPMALPPGYTNDVGTAFATTSKGIASRALEEGGTWMVKTILSSPALSPIASQLVVDSAVGVWDLGYAKTLLEKLGVIKVGSSF
jgi:RHS repeat-associated protein